MCDEKYRLIYHPNPADFIENASEYGALGKTLVALSNLEFSHDQFIFKMREVHHDISVCLSKRFPRQFTEKTNFLIGAVSSVKKLRQVPIFQTGELDLLWLQYQLDELYGIRAIVAHGSVFFSVSTDERITWTFERYVHKGKNTWATEAVNISNGYLASVHNSAFAIKNYFIRLTKCLEGNSSWEEDYQIDKQIRQNRRIIADLLADGTISDHQGWLGAFPPLKQIE